MKVVGHIDTLRPSPQGVACQLSLRQQHVFACHMSHRQLCPPSLCGPLITWPKGPLPPLSPLGLLNDWLQSPSSDITTCSSHHKPVPHLHTLLDATQTHTSACYAPIHTWVLSDNLYTTAFSFCCYCIYACLTWILIWRVSHSHVKSYKCLCLRPYMHQLQWLLYSDFLLVLFHTVFVNVAGLTFPTVLSCCIWFQG